MLCKFYKAMAMKQISTIAWDPEVRNQAYNQTSQAHQDIGYK